MNKKVIGVKMINIDDKNNFSVQPAHYKTVSTVARASNKRLWKSKGDILDIKSNGIYPANVLSNFSKTKFSIDGFEVRSIEGFLQALKTDDLGLQKQICMMSGYDAKAFSKRFRREKSDILCFWNGVVYKKNSPEFRQLISEVLKAKEKTFNGKTFNFQGHEIASVNSFLLAVKSNNIEEQKKLFLVPDDKISEIAKSVKLHYTPRILYWNGESFSRDSEKYQNLLKKVYKARFDNDLEFRNAIRISKHFKLCHTIGKDDIGDTVLTRSEFINHIKSLEKYDTFIQKIKDFCPNVLKYIKK